MVLTEKGLEDFNIDKFVAHCVKLDAVDMILKCQNLRIFLQGIKKEYRTNKTAEDFAQFVFHLELIIIKEQVVRQPIGMSDENFIKVKPIIEKLVTVGYLKKTG